MKNLISIVLLLALSACGGGGGNGGGSQPGAQPGLLDVTFSTSSLNFEFAEGDEPRPQTMSASASGNTTQNVLMGAEVSGSGLALPISVVVNNLSRTAAITVTPARGLKAGTYSGTIKMIACTTQDCQQHHNGSPFQVAYKVTVRPPEKAILATMAFSATSLSFAYDEGKSPTPQAMTAKATGITNRDVTMRAELTGDGLAMPLRVAVDSLTKTATVTATPAYGLKAGVYNGAIKLMACASSDCSVQHLGSPYMVPYSLTVRPPLKAAVSSLNLAAPESGSSAPSLVALTLPSSGSLVEVGIAYDGGAGGWLSAQINGATVTVQASAKSLPAGTYRATLLLSLADRTQSIAVPVVLTVSSGLVVPENTALKVDSGTAVQEMQGKLAVLMAPGAAATSWTASSSQDWLKLASPSGSITSSPIWNIDLAAFARLANNQRHTAVVTIKTDAALPQKTWTLEVQKELAEIRGLDSLALLAGQGGDVLLYGKGFDKLPAGLVSVVGAQPTAVALLSPEVLRLTMPVLQAGSYAVSLRSASSLATPGKAINVTPRTSYGYLALDTQGQKSVLVWDAVSKSAFVVNQTLKSVMRYAPVGGKFQLITTRSFPFVDSIAMAPDHSALILRSGSTKIYKLSPTDLSTISLINLSENSTGYDRSLSVPLPVTGDNRLMQGPFWIDLDTGAGVPATFSRHTDTFGQADWLAVSGNGMRALWPDSGLYTPHKPVLWTDLIGARYTAFGVPDDTGTYFYDYAVNHDGSKWYYNANVVDFDMKALGAIEVPDGWVGTKSVFSRDGARLYVYAQVAGRGPKPRVYVFDTGAVLTTTVAFPLLGFIEFDDLPNCPYSASSSQDICHTFTTSLAITDDDQTLLLAGDVKFVVLPVPQAMRAPVTVTVRQTRQVLGGQTVIPAARR